ncbi:baculoviral IAP repeat-containing protein 7-like isoform X1 [Planococcus citri]|uniref:baculoviral IAP repeat-containing protein 7-like isoform X1 n=1 Tax=Planococcus citri TaxID=170843 RepID=UPI0031F8729C
MKLLLMTPLPNNSAEGFYHSSQMDEDLTPECSSGSSSQSQDGWNLLDESDRLKTMADWSHPFANKRSLAAAGFFYIHYENTGDLIKCPFCHLDVTRSNWEEGADPFELHRRLSPNCPYLNRLKSRTTTDCLPSRNMPNLNNYENGRPSTPSNSERQSLFQINTSSRALFRNYASFDERIKSYESTKWPSNFKSQPDTLSKAGFFYLGPGTKTACFQCGGAIMFQEDDDAFVEHKHFFPKCMFVTKHELLETTSKLKEQIAMIASCTPSRPEQNLSLRTANLDLSLESDRLKTFHDWHYSLDKNEMAKVGFYYTGKGDAVICYYCENCVRNFEPGETPAGEHLKHAPDCVMAPLCREILLKQTGCSQPMETAAPLFNGFDTCGLHDVPNQQPPKYPQFLTLEHRMRSFRDWPEQFSIRPRTLWEAGFFYTGTDDRCICYQCGTGLKNWKENDDPWTEHALWNPECEYLVSAKGSAFVNDARRNRHDTSASSEEERRCTEEEIRDIVVTLQNVFRALNLPESNIGNVNENHGCDIKNDVASSNRRAVNIADEDSDDNENDERRRLLCKICFMNNWSKLLYPCGHVACGSCAKNLVNCAFCRTPILDRVQMYVE